VSVGVKFTYIPYKGGGEVVVQLVGGHVDSESDCPVLAGHPERGGLDAAGPSGCLAPGIGENPDILGLLNRSNPWNIVFQ
jgi:hypothetical protein